MQRDNLRLILAVLAALPSLDALAEGGSQDPHWYLQGSVGLSQSRASTDDINRQFWQNGLDATVTGFDDSDIGYGLALGYQWHRSWSMEAGLRNLGEFAIDISANTTNTQALYNRIENLHPESAKGGYAALNYHLLFNESWSAAAKIGVLSWRGDYDTHLLGEDQGHVGDEKQTGTDAFFGLAAHFQLNPRWQTGLGWERYSFDNHDVDYIHLGLTYRFGERSPQPAPSHEPAPAPATTRTSTIPAAAHISRVECELFTGSLQGVNFAPNSHRLTDAARQNLQTAAAVLQKYPHLKINIQAHTDSVGGEEANRNLSEARANSVRNFFIEQNINPARLSATGFGESFPIQDNATPQGQAANRRVELKLVSAGDCPKP